MAGPRQRPSKRRIVLPQADQGGDIQISTSGAKIRLTWTTLGVLIVILLAILAVMHYRGNRKGNAPAGSAGRAVIGSVQSDDAAARPADNKPPLVSSAVIIPGQPGADTALGISYSASDPEGDALTLDFRWYVDSVLVQSGSNNSLQPGPYHKGSTVYAEVVPADQYSTGTSFTTSPVVIVNSPPSVSSVTLGSDTAYIGAVLTATAQGRDPDVDEITYTYQWRVNGNPVGKPVRENTFDTSALHKKDIVSVMVDFTDGTASGGPVLSNSVVLQNRKPEITSTAPVALQGRVYSYAVAARDPDGDVLKYRLDRCPEGMTIDPASGQIRWELPKDMMFPGRNEVQVKVTVDDGDGGVASQEFSIILTDVLTY